MTVLRIFTFTDWKQLDSSYNNKISKRTKESYILSQVQSVSETK